jgi:signal recognition particle receptor subunit alpha
MSSLAQQNYSSEVPDLDMNQSRDEGSLSDVEESDSSVDTALASSKSHLKSSKSTPQEGRIVSFFKGITGQKPLDQEDIQEVLKKMREHLIGKNVASNIADQICESVGLTLLGQRTGTFQSKKLFKYMNVFKSNVFLDITSLVKEGTENAIRKILTPKSSTDVFTEMTEAKTMKRPYVITFVGVNGVGKSTNLSKVCFWALQKQFKVLIAACDTFRSGAVEQLRVHVRNLTSLGVGKVDLYERGYGKDAAAIAKEAIQYGNNKAFI